jgi:hypothetical protein
MTRSEPPTAWWGREEDRVGWSGTRKATAIVVLIVGSIFAIAVSVERSLTGPGSAVADRIRTSGSPLIENVSYLPPNPFFGQMERMSVDLVADATEAEGIRFWCDVVKPAGGEAVDISVIGGSYPDIFKLTTWHYDRNIPDCP